MLRKLGLVLWVATVILVSVGSTGCRSDKPPKIDICLGDGVGGADCTLREGSELRAKCMYHNDANGEGWYCPPSALANTWITTQTDMESFSSFCYDVSKKTARKSMRSIARAIYQ